MPRTKPFLCPEEDAEALRRFHEGYVSAMSAMAEDADIRGRRGVAKEADQTTFADCQKFWGEMRGLIFHRPFDAGLDFYYTRHRHGCGFWDGDWPSPWDAILTEKSHEFPETFPFVREDGLVDLL